MKKIITIIPLLVLLGFLIFLSACDEFSPHTMIQLTFQDEIHARSPVWSPEGSKIVFYGGTYESWGLWTMDPQGDNFYLILDRDSFIPPAHEFIPNDFSDDSYLLFSDDLDNIYYLSLAGGDPVFICEGSSPTIKGNLDGTYNIAYFDSNSKGPDSTSGIYLTDIHGSEPQLLIPDGGHPHWSHNGSKLVFANQEKLWIMDMNTTETTLLYDSSEGYSSACYPRWSQGGYWIAFCMWSKETFNWEIFIIPSSGGNPTRLTELPYDPDFEPPPPNSLSWSPEGKWIVFERSINCELWKVRVE